MITTEQPNGPTSPIQQLGAVPGTIERMVPGLRDYEPEDIDGEFASSAEVEIAPLEGDYDTELPEELLHAVRQADYASRELENLDYDGLGADYGTDVSERVDDLLRLSYPPRGGPWVAAGGGGDNAGAGEAIFAQTQHQEGAG